MATMVATRTAAARKTWPAGVPMPAQNCDGTWRTPLYIPEEGRWELSDWDAAGENTPWVIATREWCGDRECMGMHQEDLSAKQLAGLRKARPELFPTEPRRTTETRSRGQKALRRAA